MKSGFNILGINADWKALAFCVLAASTFWFFNAMNHNYTVDIYHPFELRYDDTRVVPVSPLPKKIKINVTGYGWRLFRKYLGIKSSPLVYHPENLPLKEYAVSSELSPIIRKQLTDLEFNYIVKDSMFFRFDYLKEKKVRVIIDSSDIAVASSYKIISPIIINPDSIIFRGPATFLSAVPDSVKVRIEKTDIKENFQENIKMPEKGYPKVEMLNKEVKVRFEVKKFEKQSMSVPLVLSNFPDNLRQMKIERSVILTYYVEEGDKNKLQGQDIEVQLDYLKMDRSDSTIKPKLNKKPLFLKDYYFTPHVVKINYEQ